MTAENEAAPVRDDQGCEKRNALGTRSNPTTTTRGDVDEAELLEREVRYASIAAQRALRIGDRVSARRWMAVVASANRSRSPQQVAYLEAPRGLR